jgi:hypothetical protein
MGAIFLIPISLHIIYHSHRWICLAGFALCLLPALNIGVILALESPSILWQQLTGVNVAVGKDREEVTQAYTFLEELRRQNKRATLYSFFSGALPDIFITVGVYEEIVRPDLPVFKSISTVDWMNGFVVKTDQLLGADYILIRKDLGQKAEKLSERPIDTSDSENIVFQEWLSGLSENAGVKAVSDGRVLRLLEIIDRKEFERAVELFVSSHSWRSEFIAANLLPRWSNEEEVFGYVKNPAMKEIEFEGIYVLHALSICHSDTGLNVELWWEELRHEKTMRQWYMFFQLLDRSGKILLDQVLTLDKYDPPFDNRRWRYGSVTFENLLPKEAASLAFGIFRPKDDFLMPDKGFRDWGGVRILITIPSIDIKSATDNTNDTSVFSILSDREIPNGPT